MNTVLWRAAHLERTARTGKVAPGRPALPARRTYPPTIEAIEGRVLLSGAPGTLDASFANGGSLFIPLASPLIPLAASVAVQPNGQIDLLTSAVGAPQSPVQLHVTRLQTSGAVDPSFGTNGVVSIPQSAPSQFSKLIVESNGDLLAFCGPTLAQLTPTGALDLAFGAGKGYIALPASASSAAMQSNGKILVLAGSSLFRFNADGSTDATYGVNGVASLSSEAFVVEQSGGVALDPQGRAVVSLGVTTPDVRGEFVLERLDANGALDTSFGVNGFVNDGGQPDDAGGSSIAISPADGSIHLAANYDENAGDDMTFLYTFNSGGAFVAGGMQAFGGGILDMTFQPDNQLLDTGYEFQNQGGNTNIVVQGSFGTVQLDYTPGDNNRGGATGFGDYGSSVAMQPDGNVLVAGYTDNAFQGVDTIEFTLSRVNNTVAGAKNVISGTVFNDLSADGIQDPGEPGISGVTVYEDPNYNHKLDPGEQSTVTDAYGNYTFTNLPADPEIIRVIPTPGAQQTLPGGGIGNYVGKNTGKDITGKNFGLNVPKMPTPAQISGTVFEDANRDGIQNNGETGVGNVFVYMDPNYNHKWDPATEQSAVTDGAGHYIFNNPPADPEIIRIILPSGATQTAPVNGAGFYVGKNDGQLVVSNADFGIFTPGGANNAAIAGSVFSDANGNHIQNSGEFNIPGVKVFIDLNHTGKLDAGDPTTTTIANGTFSFPNLHSGTYTVFVVPPTGYRQTLPLSGGITVSVAAGGFAPVGAFGLTSSAYVGGILFNDLNGNGVQNVGEGPISGWTVYLDLNKDGIKESNEPAAHTPTTSVGYWYFRSVAPGTYTIRAVTPSGWKITRAYTATFSSGQMVTNGAIGARHT